MEFKNVSLEMTLEEIANACGFPQTSSGRLGSAFEIALTLKYNGKAVLSGQGKIDLTINGKRTESKVGCGCWKKDGNFKGCSMVAYCPEPLGCATIDRQEWFFVPKSKFFQILEDLGLLRYKTSTSGSIVSAIQTFKTSRKKSDAFYEMLDSANELEA